MLRLSVFKPRLVAAPKFKPSFALRALHTSSLKRSLFTPHTAIEPPQFYKERQSEHDIEVNLNDEGLPIAMINGEEVVIPELQRTLEFTLESPCDEHTFEEPPVVVRPLSDESEDDD